MKSCTQPKVMEIILLFTYCPLSVAPTNTLTPPPPPFFFCVCVCVCVFVLPKAFFFSGTLFTTFTSMPGVSFPPKLGRGRKWGQSGGRGGGGGGVFDNFKVLALFCGFTKADKIHHCTKWVVVYTLHTG